MHDGPFLGLQGVHRAQIIAIDPDGRARVLIPGALGETELLAQSLVPIGEDAIGRTAAVTMMDDQPLILGLIQPPILKVVTDGEAQVIEAQKELILRCGAASITMTSDGRVTIRGTQLLSRSEGANRVQGATVQLN
ncbi:DUF6484 domain-containing protein [Tabrizicola sp.]|uniref:DUF6484 domain-containing protein n=1 Tax=Tabrizicola sp. TaxID=2005166 RepID=UPI0025EEAD6D|nr:DUF6484 domain-containing protein [Tabrizicola sp.]